MKIHISTGNSKLGTIPSISLPPVLSCDPAAPCFKDCYASKIPRRFPLVKSQWLENFLFYKEQPVEYFNQIFQWLEVVEPKYFRWHVGGDIPDKLYLTQLISMACWFPGTKFMLFTKRYSWVQERELPPNLVIRISAWPYSAIPTGNTLPVAWVRADLRTKKLPKNTHLCDGMCDRCYFCWEERKDIILKPH